MSLNHENIDINSPSIQEQILEQQAIRCHNGSILNAGWCPKIWDSILCWPSTAPNELAELPCPHYIAGFDLPGNATRQCMSDGTWYWNSETNNTWSNYTQCYSTQSVTVLMDFVEVQTDNRTLIKKYLPVVKNVSTVGYAVSFFTLVIAFFILATMKKLRCSRNMLHMHLFASFITRAFMALLKDILFVSGIGLSSNFIIKNGESYWVGDESNNNWQCKAFTSLWQYFILANYFWILMEGLYLHNLVIFALVTDINSSILGYAVLGWGLPALCVIPWIFLRISYENTFCWTTNKNTYIFFAIRIPTIISIVINFVFFINIIRVVFSKLKSTVSEETQRYKKWAKSTLVLVPLFGIHYSVFLGLSYSIGVDEKVELIWLTGDQLFASFQGFFVAVLYCFLNAEVRSEVTRSLRSLKWPKWSGVKYLNRNLSKDNTTIEKKIQSKPNSWWKPPWACVIPNEHPVHQSTPSMASRDYTSRRCSLTNNFQYLLEVSSYKSKCSEDISNTSPLCSDYTDHSMTSFFSNTSEASMNLSNTDKNQDNERWSDSDCCSLVFELHSYSLSS